MANVLLGWLAFSVVAAVVIVVLFLRWVGPNDEMDSDLDGDHWE